MPPSCRLVFFCKADSEMKLSIQGCLSRSAWDQPMEREGRRVDDQREKLSWNAAHLQPRTTTRGAPELSRLDWDAQVLIIGRYHINLPFGVGLPRRVRDLNKGGFESLTTAPQQLGQQALHWQEIWAVHPRAYCSPQPTLAFTTLTFILFKFP